jgi:acetolactate synthase-1/2/3 large subunit
VDERDLNKDFPADHLLIGDAKLVLRQVLDDLGARGTRGCASSVATEIAAIKSDERRDWLPRRESSLVPMSPYRVIDEIGRALSDVSTVVTHDAGSPRDQLSPFWTAVGPRSYLGWGKSTHLGYGYGMALGAKLAEPDKLVLNFMGDAAFGMTGMEVETAVRLGIPIVTVLLNNGAMACYEERYPLAVERHRLKFLSGDYAALARALGAHSERVERPEAIVPALERARQAADTGIPAVLEMVTAEDSMYSKYW